MTSHYLMAKVIYFFVELLFANYNKLHDACLRRSSLTIILKFGP